MFVIATLDCPHPDRSDPGEYAERVLAACRQLAAVGVPVRVRVDTADEAGWRLYQAVSALHAAGPVPGVDVVDASEAPDPAPRIPAEIPAWRGSEPVPGFPDCVVRWTDLGWAVCKTDPGFDPRGLSRAPQIPRDNWQGAARYARTLLATAARLHPAESSPAVWPHVQVADADTAVVTCSLCGYLWPCLEARRRHTCTPGCGDCGYAAGTRLPGLVAGQVQPAAAHPRGGS